MQRTRSTDYQTALQATWVVSGWGTTQANAGADGMGGALPQYLQWALAKPANCDDYYYGTYPGKEIW